MKIYVKVGRFNVEARVGYATFVRFSSGEHGRKEAGDFAFWTAILKRPKKIPGTKRIAKKIFGRAHVGFSAGDRFDRMRRETREDLRWYVEVLERGANIKYIRPSTLREVTKWMLCHSKDTEYAGRIKVGRNDEFAKIR